ncbi:MAG: hypothetical protein M0R80_08650 [Proteobacteria bacterium]|jgi:hypothetical protein|nr:hypothetical protein [Pseudomonadota bacterium]
MVQKLVKQEAKVITKDGECKIQINIQLDINVNEHGVTVKASDDKIDESIDWAIPDFTTGQKLKFGKEEK